MGKIVTVYRSIANARIREAVARHHFSAHVYCGQTVAHLSNCWALVYFLQAGCPSCRQSNSVKAKNTKM